MTSTTTEPQPRLVVEAFAGPGGWATGLRMLTTALAAVGIRARSVGFEWDDAACRTGKAAGHTRVRADVAQVRLGHLAGLVWLLIMSPPCQAWSRSGKRKGILDQAAIFTHAQRVIAAGEWVGYDDAGPLPAGEGDEGGTWHDARSPLVLEVLRWVLETRPTNIALEQVPDVLPFWQLIARWLKGLGYNVWCGELSAERYGVPQTRKRAILIASTERAVSAPPATHTAYDSALADGGRWHGTDGDLFGDGLEPWVSMADALEWPGAPVVNTRGDRKTSGGNEFTADRPSWALTEKTRSWEWRLHTNRDQRPDGTRQVIDPAERPAPTLTAKSGGRWVYRNGNQANAARRDVDEPAPTVMFAERSNKVDWETPEGESVRVSVQEAAILQSFPPDYPWQGAKSAAFRQVGDAVPPLLSAHVLAATLGVSAPASKR